MVLLSSTSLLLRLLLLFPLLRLNFMLLLLLLKLSYLFDLSSLIWGFLRQAPPSSTKIMKLVSTLSIMIFPLLVLNILTLGGFVFKNGHLVVILLCTRFLVLLTALTVSLNPTVGFYTIAMLDVLWVTIVIDSILLSCINKRTDISCLLFIFYF
mgnify:FL=1